MTASAFESESDARLRDYLRALPSGTIVHVDYRSAAAVSEILSGHGVATMHRSSALESMMRVVPACLRRLLRMMEGAQRRDVVEIAPVILRDRYRILPREAALVEARSRECTLLRMFLDLRDGALAIFSTPDPEEASSALAAWRGRLCGRMADAFAPMANWLRKWAPLVLNAGYGLVSVSEWRQAVSGLPNILPSDTPRRAVVRAVDAALREVRYGPSPTMRTTV